MSKAVLSLMLVTFWTCVAGAEGFDRPFANWQAQRFHNTSKQRTDFTCGAASLSIIAQHYYGKAISEPQFTLAIRKTYTDEEWKDKIKNGLSLLDMKRAAEKFGFAVEGLKLTLDQLRQLNGPVVIHLDKGFIQHFAVFKGIQGDRVYLADPISGNSRVPLYRFLHEWTGYALAIWIEGQDLPTKNELAVSPRDTPNEWEAARDALYARPLTSAFSPFAQ
jgi:predicted double-glycine peptidase